jgi:hypothetical protein
MKIVKVLFEIPYQFNQTQMIDPEEERAMRPADGIHPQIICILISALGPLFLPIPFLSLRPIRAYILDHTDHGVAPQFRSNLHPVSSHLQVHSPDHILAMEFTHRFPRMATQAIPTTALQCIHTHIQPWYYPL